MPELGCANFMFLRYFQLLGSEKARTGGGAHHRAQEPGRPLKTIDQIDQIDQILVFLYFSIVKA